MVGIFYSYKFAFGLVRRKASEIPLLFRNRGTSLKFGPPKVLFLDLPLMTLQLSVDFFKQKSFIQSKDGRQMIRHVEYLKIPPSLSLFVTVLRLGQQGWVFTI